MDPEHTFAAAAGHDEVCAAVLSIIFEYSLHKFDDTMAQLEVGRPKFLAVIRHFVTAGKKIEMCLPAFPFKSSNKTYKVLGRLPDKAEELALARLESICQRIESIYPPGATIMIISDGLVYNDLLSVSDQDTWAYGEALREMTTNLGFSRLTFSRIKDLVNFPSPPALNEITYVASATNFRRCLLNQYGDDNIDIEREVNTNPDTMATYLGYRRFLVSDLEYIFPLGASRSKTAYKKDVKFLAQQMLIRGYAFAGAVKAAYPNHLRLSIHQSTGEHKISLSLLNTKTGFTTPWHCSVALMTSGEWLSAPKGDFEQDTTLHVVEENGRPSFFRQEIAPSEQKDKEVPTSGIFTANIPVEDSTCQGSIRDNNAHVGDRTSKGSSTAETTRSDSSQDTSPQKCEAPTPEASQLQNKGGLLRRMLRKLLCM